MYFFFEYSRDIDVFELHSFLNLVSSCSTIHEIRNFHYATLFLDSQQYSKESGVHGGPSIPRYWGYEFWGWLEQQLAASFISYMMHNLLIINKSNKRIIFWPLFSRIQKKNETFFSHHSLFLNSLQYCEQENILTMIFLLPRSQMLVVFLQS